ncbi:MAG: MFS transporter [Actinobacteria bacterium]|nr:MFS transporter [Actinomycetota bacterium]
MSRVRHRSTKSQKAWYFYDWANSAYVTTTTTVLFGPYLTHIALSAVNCDKESTCDANLSLIGLQIAPGSLFLYTITFTTLLSAFLLPLLGAYADIRHDKHKLMAKLAWIGSIGAASMFFVSGTNWLLGIVLLTIANLALGGSLVVYDAILNEISTPNERDAVSSKGWALGYVGGGMLLIANLAYVTMSDSSEISIRISLLTAGVWWAAWTFVPYFGIKNSADAPKGGTDFTAVARNSFSQLRTTLSELKNFPNTKRFLLAYLFYNDGVQTVIYAAAIYGEFALGLKTSNLIAAIVIVQLVAIAGALITGKLAARIGARATIRNSLFIWIVVIIGGRFVPYGDVTLFFLLAAAIGFVLGGTQALSRSLFSQLVPVNREAEYFALYQACERGTSWLGTLLFALTYQFTGDYRNAIIVLIVFFVVGGSLLHRVDVRAGIKEAGNEVPAVV